MTVAAFIGIALIHLTAAISPGPSFVVSVRTAAAEGLLPAIGLAIGLGLGAVVWAMSAMLGLAVLLETAPKLLMLLRVCGGAFLMYLAWKMWKHASDPLPDTTNAQAGALPRKTGSAILLGLKTQLANPKPAVFFLAVFAGLVPPGTQAPLLALLLLVIFLQETLWYVLVARVFSLHRVRLAYGRIKARLDRAFGGLIALFGAKIALS